MWTKPRILCALTSILAVVRADAAAQPHALSNACVETVAATRGLAATFRDLGGRTNEPIWIGYSVPIAEGEHQMCCNWSDGSVRGDACCAGCRLELAWGSAPHPGSVARGDPDAPRRSLAGRAARGQPGERPASTPSASRPVRLEGPTSLIVMVRVERGAVGKIRTFSDDCPLDAGGRAVYWLTGIAPADSVGWLATFTAGDEKLASSVL